MEHREMLLDNLREMLQEVLHKRFEGTPYAKLARVHGYADGYMRAMLDAGLIDKQALIELVGDERRRFLDASDEATTATTAAA